MIRKSHCVVAMFALLLIPLIGSCKSQLSDHPMPTIAATEIEPSVVSEPSLELLWGSQVVGANDWIDTALVDDGILYYSTTKPMTGEQYVGAFDLQTRQSRWSVTANADLPVMIVNEYVLLIDETDSSLTALRNSDGLRTWHVPLPVSKPYEAATSQEFAFVGGGNEVVAMDSATGAFVWKYSLPQGFEVDPFKVQRVKDRREYSALTFAGKTLYVRAVRRSSISSGSLDCLLLALNVQNGRELWAFPFVIEMPRGDEPSIATQPAVGDTGLLVFTWGGTGYFLDKTTGQAIWEKTVSAWAMGIAPHIWGSYTIVEQHQKLVSIDTQSGQVQWSNEIYLIASPLWIGEGIGFLVYSIDPALLTAIDLQTGDIIAERSLSSLVSQDERAISTLAGDSRTLYIVVARNVYAFSMP